jgi:rhodanese-related sulfurtransferase
MPVRHINALELRDYLDQCDASPLLLDVREGWEFEICRIEGSAHMPMSGIGGNYFSLDPDQETVVICHHGMRSLQVAEFLIKAGFKRVLNLRGGIDAWSREVDPKVPTY